jgi:hypothetical protein
VHFGVEWAGHYLDAALDVLFSGAFRLVEGPPVGPAMWSSIPTVQPAQSN